MKKHRKNLWGSWRIFLTDTILTKDPCVSKVTLNFSTFSDEQRFYIGRNEDGYMIFKRVVSDKI